MQLFWGEPLDGVAERIDRLKALTQSLGRAHAPLEFGLRITTLVQDTTEEAWRDAEAKVAQMAASTGKNLNDGHQRKAVGSPEQQATKKVREGLRPVRARIVDPDKPAET